MPLQKFLPKPERGGMTGSGLALLQVAPFAFSACSPQRLIGDAALIAWPILTPWRNAPLLRSQRHWSWDLYRAASKAKWVGSVEASDESSAIEAAAIE
jgi:hypothetical protein